MLAKIVSQFAIMAMSFFIGLGVLMYGWGLQPKSWGWIVGGAFANLFFLIVSLALTKSKD